MLSQEEINQRLIKLRNYEQLYPQLKSKYEEVKAENKQLRQRVSQLGIVIK